MRAATRGRRNHDCYIQHRHRCRAAAIRHVPQSPVSWEERAAFYQCTIGRPAYITTEAGWTYGYWVMGNSYKKKTDYYGGFQGDFLRRVAALFPDKRHVLHAFSGRVDVDVLPGDTVDIDNELNPTYVDDCQVMRNVPVESYDLVIADPPYSEQDAERYGTTMVKRNLVMRALQRLPIGAHVAWLDQALPMYSKVHFVRDCTILITGSTNHRVRALMIFRRRDAAEEA